MKNKIEYIILGSGGHASVLIDLIEGLNLKVKGVLIKDYKFKKFLGYSVLGDDQLIKTFDSKNTCFVNGIGLINNSLLTRTKIFKYLMDLNLKVPVLKHKNSIVSSRSNLKEGCQILAGANIGVNVTIGENTIINSNVTIEHDSVIAANCHIAPGGTICGNVKIGEGSFIGAGTTIINNISIAKNCFIGAGSLVLKDIKKSGKYFGSPLTMKS